MARKSKAVEKAMAAAEEVAPIEAAAAEPERAEEGSPSDDAPPAGDDEDIDAAIGEGEDDDVDGTRFTADDMQIARECVPLDQNDRDNARRMLRWFGRDLAFVPGMGWLVWRLNHWKRDESDLYARFLAQELVDRIKLECLMIGPSKGQESLLAAAEHAAKKDAAKLTPADLGLIKRAQELRDQLRAKKVARRKFAVSSGNAGKTEAMLKQAASLKTVPPELLDANRMVFNCRNVTLRFSRLPDPEQDMDASDVEQRFVGDMEATPHDRADMITKCADVIYDPEATCPHFLEALELTQPDPKMRLFLQVFHAYALLVGGNDEQKLIFHYGTGANGKTAFIEAIGRMADAYRAVVSPDTITGDAQRDGSKANSDIARLVGARFVTIEELPRGVGLKENLIKALTGGTRMTARFLQKEIFEFDPDFTAVMSGNDMPTVSGTDYGIWRRLLIVKWGVTIPPEKRIAPGILTQRFNAERPGILNWLIEGLMLYLKHGLDPFIPRDVVDFTEEYREERDPIGSFASQCIVESVGSTVRARDMQNAYTTWCEANGLKPWNNTALGIRLNALGYKKFKSQVVYYSDIKLQNVPSKYDAPPRADGDPGWSPGEGR